MKNNKPCFKTLVVFLFLFVTQACGTSLPEKINEVLPPTETDIMGSEEILTNTPIPTITPLSPTDTPVPTSTPVPTNTPPPPTLTPTQEIIELPDPAELSGNVTVWNAYGPGTAEYRAFMDLIARARIRFPNLTIKPVHVPFGEIFSKFRAEASAGIGPDLFIAPNDDLGGLARDQLLLQLDPYQTYLEGVSQVGIEGMRVDGKLYGIPESSKVVALYYKKTMVDSPPATTDELLNLVKEGKLLVNFLGAYHLFGWTSAFGGQLFDENNRCIADQGGWVDAFDYLLELEAAGAIFESDFGKAEDLFLRGGAAMLVNGPWKLIDYKQVFGNNLGVVILPTGPQGAAGPFVGIDGFYVNQFSNNPAAAVSLALFLTKTESGQIFTDKGGHVPVNTGVIINDPLLSVFYQAVDSGIIRPQGPEFNNYWGPFDYLFINVLENGANPEQAIAYACAEMNRANGK